MSWFTVLWLVWLLSFAVIEGIAIWSRRKGSTLSEFTWNVFCLKGPKAGRSTWCILRRVTFFAFWIWLTIHFVTGGAWL